MKIFSSYESFLLNWNLLQQEAEKESQNEKIKWAKSDLRKLLNKIKTDFDNTKLNTYLRACDDLIKQKNITFDALWTVFSSRIIIYEKIFLKHDSNQEQIFIVENNMKTWSRERKVRSKRSEDILFWKIRCWTYDFTDQKFQRRCVILSIDQFDDSKLIANLLFYSLSVLELIERSKIETRLVKREKKFRKYCMSDQNHRMYKYNEDAILDQRNFRNIQIADDINVSWAFFESAFLMTCLTLFFRLTVVITTFQRKSLKLSWHWSKVTW